MTYGVRGIHVSLEDLQVRKLRLKCTYKGRANTTPDKRAGGTCGINQGERRKKHSETNRCIGKPEEGSGVIWRLESPKGAGTIIKRIRGGTLTAENTMRKHKKRGYSTTRGDNGSGRALRFGWTGT